MIAAVTNHLWQSTLFAATAWLVAGALRRNAARIRCWVWIVASCKFLVPFSLLVMLGSHVPWGVRATRELPPAVPAVSVAVTTLTEPFSFGLSPAPAAHSTSSPLLLIVVSAWLFGLVAIAVVRLRGWCRIRAAVRASVPFDVAPDVERRRPKSMRASVPIRVVSGVLEPGIVGWWRPILLVPAGVTTSLTTAQWDAVLAHELAHVRRRDNLTSAVHMVVETICWFHPVVWWIGARLVKEREHACDEEVLRLGGDPRVYADAILNVCKLYVESPLACVSGVTGSDVKTRLHAILAEHLGCDLTRTRKIAIAAACVAALALPFAAGMANARLRAQDETSGPVQRFDVVSVKPCDPRTPPPGGRGAGPGTSVGRLHLDCQSLGSLIHYAYVAYANGHFNPSGMAPNDPDPPAGADWMRSDRFTIDATAEGAPSAAVMLGPMLQGLLEDRFKLKIRRETREIPADELAVASGGAKLAPSRPGVCVQRDWNAYPSPSLESGQHWCTTVSDRDTDGRWILASEGATLDQMAANSQSTRQARYQQDGDPWTRHVPRRVRGRWRFVRRGAQGSAWSGVATNKSAARFPGHRPRGATVAELRSIRI